MITKPIKLSALLYDMSVIDEALDLEITGLALNSKQVKPGDLFFAYPGDYSDGRNYIAEAIKQGAVAVLCETGSTINNAQIPIFYITQLRYKLGVIAARFYNHPSQSMQVIGITGTNGKTSCSQFLAQALSMHNYPCAVMGTIGVGFLNKLQTTVNTTPDPITVQSQLANLNAHGAKAIAMEVTSQGLVQGRVNGVQFAIAIFTNLSRDHLDLHGTMENYARAKKMLFKQPGLKYAVINLDDDFGRALAKEFANSMQIYGYSITDIASNLPTIRAIEIHPNYRGTKVVVSTPWGHGEFTTQLLGRFNISNLLAVLTTMVIMDVPFSAALECLSKLTTVAGRMQTFGGGKQPLVVVDYSHTPDALQQVLMSLRETCQGKLWCVFGCGGDRDRGKRPLMAQVAERYSDQLIITDDNPRTEDPVQIVNDIVSGLLCPWAAEIMHDRSAAIAHAIDCAAAGDIILVAGKGHETYQIKGAETLHFDDAEQVQVHLATKQKIIL